MEEVSLTETATRYFSDLFLCCDVEKTGKIPMLKATELFRSANISNDVLSEITSLAGIPDAALHISRAQFYSCLKLIAAHQASIPLRQELIVSTMQMPLPRFSWKESPNVTDNNVPSIHTQSNGGLNPIPPPPSTDRKNSLTRRQEWQEVRPSNSRRNSTTTQQHQQQQQDSAVNSDVQSTDSEVEQNESSGGGGGIAESGHGSSGREMHRRRAGSPEAWSTNSDSPTPTNSVAERPWAKENLWHGLLGDEHRQLLGTEEESSDRHSSDDDDNEHALETVYQITPEQRDYYYKQFKAVQHDPNGLLSGPVARVFFEKSRIPVEELRHIWQLCDVTRDGALSLSEFTAAMHLVVLRRNNIPLPTTLPACLHPNVLHLAPQIPVQTQPQEPPEADLLHLNDDDDEENTENTIISGGVTAAPSAVAPPTEKNVMNISTLSTSSQDVPPTQWTKFTESPTSNLSSPGPKPVNFDMQRTAQAVVSDPQILHPVPLRVTPVAGAVSNSNNSTTAVETHNQEVYDGVGASARSNSPKQIVQAHNHTLLSQNSDLRAIQRPQAKKLPNKSVGAIPPPPQREPSVGSTSSSGGIIGGAGGDADISTNNQQQQAALNINKKEVQPPLPPPRPHRHGRSSSLDLNKFKISTTGNGQQGEQLDQNNEQQHSLPPQQQQQSQALLQQASSVNSTNAATAMPLSRISLQSNQRVSAFEVYRKPNTPRNSQSPPSLAAAVAGAVPQPSNVHHSSHSSSQMQSSQPQPLHPPPPAPFGAAGAAAIAGPVVPSLPNADLYEKRVNAITETLRHVTFKPDSNMTDILRYLREQNSLLLHLCNDLSDELLSVQTRKEELRQKLETNDINSAIGIVGMNNSNTLTAPPRTGSSISAPVTANVTGGSGSSGVQSNV